MTTARPIIVKIGGSTLGEHDTTLEDLAALQRQGVSLVVVHGGGKHITSWQERLGLQARFVGGLRVTDADSLSVVVAVLAGLVNKELVAALQSRGARAWGLSGADAGLLVARVKDPALGLVGEITQVNPQPVQTLLEQGYIPVVAPLAADDQGNLLNVNADTAAGELALALEAERLVFLTDVPGVQDASGRVMPRLSQGQVKGLVQQGIITGGMLPKVEASLRALASCSEASIIDGRQPHSLLQALEGIELGTRLQA